MLGSSVHAFYSANGTAWTDTGVECVWSSIATVNVDIGVGGTPSSTLSQMAAVFDDFKVKTCP
jgi:hypothetical protein